MLSADVPEFIPKAQRSKPVTASDLPGCDTKEGQLQSIAPQPPLASLADEQNEESVTKSKALNVQPKNENSETSTAANEGVETCSESVNVDQVDSGTTSQNDTLANSSFLPLDLTQNTNGVDHVIQNKYPNSKLSATVPEFVPANPVFLDCASSDSNAHLPYTPATSAAAAYMYPGSPYGYYPSWAPEVDYSAGYYSPILSTGAYSGDFYVPDGGFVYDGSDNYAQPGAGIVVDPMYYDSNMMGAMDYSSSSGCGGGGGGGGSNSGGGGGGGGVAYGAYRGNFSGRGSGRGSNNYQRRPYNPNYKRGGGRRTDSGRGGGRGGGGGGSRQPSTEIGICSQTGEMTLSKRRTQQNNVQNRSDANGWSSQAHVQASTIIKNANNWPSLAQGKSDQTSGAASPVESVSIQDSHLPLTNGAPLSIMPTDSFSSIAKKKSSNVEALASKPSKETKASGALQQKSGKTSTTQLSNEPKTKTVSAQDGQVSKPAHAEQSGLVTSNGVMHELNYAKSVSNEQKAEPLVTKPSEEVDDQPKLSKTTKKKARRKQKKLREQEEKNSQESVISTDTSVAVDVSSQVNSVAAVPSMASVLLNDLKKERIPVNSAALSHSTAEKKTQKNEQSCTKLPKETPISGVNSVPVIKSVEQTVTNSVSEHVTEQDSTPKQAEDEWITVGKKSKGKKGATNKDGERTGSLGFRQTNDWNGSNFRGSQQTKGKKFDKKQSDRPERISNSNVNSQDKQTSDKVSLPNGKNSTEASADGTTSVDGAATDVPVTEHKPKDQNDPEYKEVLRKKNLKKETLKQEKKIVRETAALQKQANARKDSKISVLQADVQKTNSTLKNSPKNEAFSIKSEEYPSLGSNKKTKQVQNLLVKGEVTKMNGIVQDSVNGILDETPAWGRSVTALRGQPAAGDAGSLPSHRDASIGKGTTENIVENSVTTSTSQSSYVAAVAAGHSTSDSSVRKKTASSQSKSAPGSSKKAKSANKSTASSDAPPRTKVKTTDKLTIDLNLVMKKKHGQRKDKAARFSTAVRCQEPVRRAAASSGPSRPTRLAVHPSAALREKGKKKSVTPIQRYKTLRARDKENFIRLLEAQRRQNERASGGSEALGGQLAGAGDMAGADGWTDVGEETPNSPKKTSSPPQQAASAPSDLVIAKLREELAHLLLKKQTSVAAAYRYDKNMVTDELRSHLEGMLSKLVQFQKRKFALEQIKAKSKRRYVCGIRESTKKVEKLKLLVVANDVAKSVPLVTEGLSQLIVKAEEHRVPVVFGMSRLRLAQICKTLKNKKVSCVGIMNYQGTEDHVNTILALLPELRKQWQRTVRASNTTYQSSEVPSSSLSSPAATPSVSTSTVSATASSSTAPSSVDGRASLGRKHDDVTVKNAKLAKGKNGMTNAANSTLQVSQKIVGILKEKRESS